MKGKSRRKIEHGITLFLIAVSLVFSVVYFGFPILRRFAQSIVDIGLSFASYVLHWLKLDGLVTPTVQKFPSNMDTILPLTWEEFKTVMELFWERFWTLKNFLRYILKVLSVVLKIFNVVMSLLLPVALTFLILRFIVYRKKDKKHNVDSKPLRAFKKYYEKVWRPIKRNVKEYFSFLSERRYYILIFAILWAYNLNILTIAFELVAFAFYLLHTFDILNVFVQVAKFTVDFSVAALFIPWWGWLLIVYKLFDIWRRRLGRRKLQKCLRKDNKYIDKFPGALFITGKQRSKKTSMLTMLKILFERRFRDKAKEKLLLRDKQFPFFPWINVEKFIAKNRKKHKIFMLYHCRFVIKFLRHTYELKDGDPIKRQRMRWLKKEYGYKFKNLLFDYDESYGLTYDDKLSIVHIFDAIEKYAQLFFLYSQKTPLDQSNYAIREDFSWVDYGNFPIFDGDLLGRTTEESYANSQYSHIIDFDTFRPRKKFDEDNPNKDAGEYGIGTCQEFDKERKNRITRSAGNAKGEIEYATQDNDGFETDTKVRGQVALIDNVDFWQWLFDAQREGDLGASNKDLANIGLIKGAAKEYLLLPFYELDEGLYMLITSIYDKIHSFFRARKGSNTLFHHMVKLLYDPLFRSWDRTHKEFTGWKLRVKMKDGGDGEELGVEEFWILSFVTYRGKFASDSCKAFYNFRFARSKRGSEDIEQYDDIEPNVGKMAKQKSYFVEDMVSDNGIQIREKMRIVKNERKARGGK